MKFRSIRLSVKALIEAARRRRARLQKAARQAAKAARENP